MTSYPSEKESAMSPRDESEYDQKMDEIIDQLEALILNAMINVLERMNERNEDQMICQTTITYI
jgi:hypothetical protein